MKRDMELIRKMLLTIEGQYDPQDHTSMSQSFIYTLEGGYSESEIDYNLVLLYEAGLVKGKYKGAGGGKIYTLIEGLTWEGHDFLEDVRSDAVWQGVQVKAQEAGLSVLNLSFEVLKNLAVSVVKENLGLKN